MMNANEAAVVKAARAVVLDWARQGGHESGGSLATVERALLEALADALDENDEHARTAIIHGQAPAFRVTLWEDRTRTALRGTFRTLEAAEAAAREAGAVEVELSGAPVR